MPVNKIEVNGKSYDVNFTFAELEAKVNGDKNIGELRFGKDGKLHRVNNHSFFTSWNTRVTTGAENEQARTLILELINDRWGDEYMAQHADRLKAVQKLLLGDNVRFEPISRDEVRAIIGMLKDGYDGAQISDVVTLIRSIKANGGAAAVEQRMESLNLDIENAVKGWNLSATARIRSANFANWAEKAESLKNDVILQQLKENPSYTERSFQREKLNRHFTATLVQALNQAGIDVPDRIVGEPTLRSGSAVDREILSYAADAVRSGNVDEENVVASVKASLREQLLQDIEQSLLGGGAIVTHRFTGEVKDAMKEVASAVIAFQESLQKTAAPNLAKETYEQLLTAMTTCGIEKVTSHDEVTHGNVVVKKLTTVSVDGSGNERTEALSEDPVLFSMPGPDGSEGEFTTLQMEKAFLRKYAEAVKSRLAGEFDAIFGNANTLKDLAACRARFERRADLFTFSGVEVIARGASENVLARDVNVLRDAMKSFVTYFNIGKRPRNQILFDEAFLNDFRCYEGPADLLSPEDLAKRFGATRRIAEMMKLFTTGNPKFFNGLGFGFPRELIEKHYSNTTFIRLVQNVDDTVLKSNPLDNFAASVESKPLDSFVGAVVKDLCELVRSSKGYGQKALDRIALRLIDLYNAKNTDLMRSLANGGDVVKVLEEGVPNEEADNEVPDDSKLSEKKYKKKLKAWANDMTKQLGGEANRMAGLNAVSKIRNAILKFVNMMGYEYMIPKEQPTDPRSTYVLTMNGVPVDADKN